MLNIMMLKLCFLISFTCAEYKKNYQIYYFLKIKLNLCYIKQNFNLAQKVRKYWFKFFDA